MPKLEKETNFFHTIAKQILQYVSDNNSSITYSKHKGQYGDFATHIDVGVEHLIIEAIQKYFPGDAVLGEETHTSLSIPEGRIWIIDPICGTNNLARGVNNFCTNIALANKGELIASCVVDHNLKTYYWSIGDKKIYQQHTALSIHDAKFDTLVEIDLGSTTRATKEIKEKHNRFMKKMMLETNYDLVSLNTSLSFTYTAIGKHDAFVNLRTNPWDICAAAFLILQSGRIITDSSGRPWEIGSVGAIAARDKMLHEELLKKLLSA